MQAAAEKAIELDPLLAEAQAAVGMTYARVGRWQQAEQRFRRGAGEVVFSAGDWSFTAWLGERKNAAFGHLLKVVLHVG
jgi:hypothetical protein